MPTYAFVVNTTISMSTEVTADSLPEAIAEAKGRAVMSLCRQCSNAPANEWSASGELDGEPADGNLVDFFIDEKPVPPDDFDAFAALWSGS